MQSASQQGHSVDDDLLDCICSAGWMAFVRLTAERAKVFHHSLLLGNEDAVTQARQRGALAFLKQLFDETYKRAGLGLPEYLRIVLGGEIS